MSVMNVQGESVSTGYYKQPVHGSQSIAKAGVVRDHRGAGPSNFNRSIFMYQTSYYSQWAAELQCELPLGSAKLRITQPRFPCRKMAVRMEEGDDFPQRYTVCREAS
jgi:MOSC domain-containing protein YiiM